MVQKQHQWLQDAVIEEGLAGRGNFLLEFHTKNTVFGQGSMRGVVNEVADMELVIGISWEAESHMKTWPQAMRIYEAHWNLYIDRVGSGTKLGSLFLPCMARVLWIHKIPDGEDVEKCEEWWHLQCG